MTAIQQATAEADREAAGSRPPAPWPPALRPPTLRPPALRPPVLRRLRRHWAFGIVLTAGLALRVLTQLAYRPALLYIDSAKYLVGSAGSEPEGYQVLLRSLDPLGGIALVAAAQHLFGLAMAVVVYLLLLRYRVPRWLATLAVAPVLLDAYQLQLEQTIMPDVLFETLIVAGLVVLLWPQHLAAERLAAERTGAGRPGGSRRTQLAAGALILGGATTVREIGGALLVPLMIFAVVTAAGWRRRAGRTALAAGCFLLPVLAYMTTFAALTGHFNLARNGPAPEYGRAAAAADCATLAGPADERALCPPPDLLRSIGGVDGLLHDPDSPGNAAPVPAGTTREALLARFSLAVFRQQPLRVAASVGRDAVRLFALTRDGDAAVTPITRWQFQTVYPTYPRTYSLAFFTQLAHRAGSSGDLVAVRPAAGFLRAYQLDGGYTPGPLYLAGLLAGVAGSVAGLVRRRALSPDGARLARACLLVTLSAVILLVGSDAFEFSWRYQLPAVVLLPLAGVLGVTAVRTASAGIGRRTRPASAG